MVIGIPPLSKDATKHPVWRKEDRFPRATGSRGGATLVTAVVAMMLIVMCMTAVMQAYMQGGRAREVQARRVAATAACREVIEGARAHGYGALQAVGEYEFPVQARQPMNGVLQIVAGPVPGSKLVTATVTWAGDDRAPAGSATLSTIMSARGIGG
jgi:type II secretory pathway pseudopilin PulG